MHKDDLNKNMPSPSLDALKAQMARMEEKSPDFCKGTNCQAERGTSNHSEECEAEHNALTGTRPSLVICDEYGEPVKEKKYDGGKADIGRMKRQFADALAAVALSGMYGAVKYEDHNGCSYKDVSNAKDRYDSAGSRHDLAYSGGEMYAEDSHLHHLSAKAWNALAQLQLAIEEGEPMIDPVWYDSYMADWERQRDELNCSAEEVISEDELDMYGVVVPTDDLISNSELMGELQGIDLDLDTLEDLDIDALGTNQYHIHNLCKNIRIRLVARRLEILNELGMDME